MNPINVQQNELDAFAKAYKAQGTPAPTQTAGIGGAITPSGVLTQNGTDAISTPTYQSRDFTVPKASTVSSDALTSGSTPKDLETRRMQMFNDIIESQQKYRDTLTPSATETSLTNQLNQSKQLSRDAERMFAREQERLQTGGTLSGEQAQAFTSDTARRAQRILGDYGSAQQGIADALNAEVNRRKTTGELLSNDIKMQRENINLLGDLAKTTLPNVIGSPFNNPLTGDVFVYTQDPTTGEIKQTKMGNVGASKEAHGAKWGSDFESLPVSVQTKLMSMSDSFGDRPEVKRFIVSTEAREFANGIASDSKSSADHQYLINVFARMLDPESAVKEGEYETIAKYAQSITDRFGLEIKRIVDNKDGFLTPDAIQAIQKTINNKFETNKKIYNKAYENAKKHIDSVSGKSGLGERLIGNYDYGTPQPQKQQYTDIREVFKADPKTVGIVETMIKDNPNLSEEDVLLIMNAQFNAQ